MKKRFMVDPDKVKETTSYKLGDMLLKAPVWALFILSVIFSIGSGWIAANSSILLKSFVEGTTSLSTLFEKYVMICILSVLSQACISIVMKAYSLKNVNEVFLKEYDKVFDSKSADITQVGPAKIHSSVCSYAVLKSERGRIIIRMFTCGIPFMVTIFNIGMQNLYAALLMVVIMAVALTCSVNSDKWFHFDTIKSSMKGDLQSISINNFLVVRMLKYMDAKKYAYKKLDDAQNLATPAMVAVFRLLYNNGLINALYQLPTLIALYIAIKSKNMGLIVFVVMNEWAIINMIDNAGMLAENLSESHGEKEVITSLKGDDIPIQDKPPMPESMTLSNVEFYYPSDKEHRNAFEIPEFKIERGKRYRFASPSGGGKSTMFRYFAGEMVANKPFDVRTFYIHQRSELVVGTVRENITLGNPYVPDAVVEELIRDVKLDKWFDALPNGLDTKIGDAGIEPSGGEASRISLLRLFIHIRGYEKDGQHRNTNDIIILDEVTSALDKRDIFIGENDLSTEEQVIQVIDRECRGCTMFVISHEDCNSRAFGFKDIVDEQLFVSTYEENGKFHHVLETGSVVRPPILIS